MNFTEFGGGVPRAPSLPELGLLRQGEQGCKVYLGMTAFEVGERDGRLRIRVRVKPRASKSRVLGLREGALELSLAAPPVDGEANSELIRTLAIALGCAKSSIEIVSGAGSRSKLVSISGFTEAELLAKLGQAGS